MLYFLKIIKGEQNEFDKQKSQFFTRIRREIK